MCSGVLKLSVANDAHILVKVGRTKVTHQSTVMISNSNNNH